MAFTRTKAKGMNKVDLFLDVQHLGFGLLLANQFAGVKIDNKFSAAVKSILNEFSFPVLNFTFSASGKLLRIDNNDLKVETWLEELELRINLKPVENKGDSAPKDDSALKVIGLLPFETKAASEDSPIQITPDLGNILKAIPSLSSTLSGIVSGLGVAVAPLFKPKPRVLHKAFVATSREFGWYQQASEDVSQEGVRYTAAVLQAKRDVSALEVEMTLTTDWIKGNVDNQTATLKRRVELNHPKEPDTPRLALTRNGSDLPIVLTKVEVMEILDIDGKQLQKLINHKKLDAFGKADKNLCISKGSLLNLLKISN